MSEESTNQSVAMVTEDISHLCLNAENADVTFIIGNCRIPAHKSILAARSPYFSAMFDGEMAKNEPIRLNVPLDEFKTVLAYIYIGRIPLAGMTEESIFNTLNRTNQININPATIDISNYFAKTLTVENCCSILNLSLQYSLKEFSEACLTFIDQNVTPIIYHDSFNTLTQDSLCTLLKRDTFVAPEIFIFQTVHNWYNHHPDADIESIYRCIRFTLMSFEELFNLVRPRFALDPNRFIDVIQEKLFSKNVFHGRESYLEKNVATAEFGSKTICGINKSLLLDGNTTIRKNDACPFHTIDPYNNTHPKGRCFLVELGDIFKINHIKMLLWDIDRRSYSYYIDVSVDQNNWERVIDRTEGRYHSWQYLYFPARPVRYIKLVGTYSTKNGFFYVVALEAYRTMENQLSKTAFYPGVSVLEKNVATDEFGSKTIFGINQSELLNGNTTIYDGYNGYTSHVINASNDPEHILIELGRIFTINHIKMLLWDMDKRRYSYYIDVSVDQNKWERVIDHTKGKYHSWQYLHFAARAVRYIKLVGTHNTENDHFHVVALEAYHTMKTIH